MNAIACLGPARCWSPSATRLLDLCAELLSDEPCLAVGGTSGRCCTRSIFHLVFNQGCCGHDSKCWDAQISMTLARSPFTCAGLTAVGKAHMMVPDDQMASLKHYNASLQASIWRARVSRPSHAQRRRSSGMSPSSGMATAAASSMKTWRPLLRCARKALSGGRMLPRFFNSCGAFKGWELVCRSSMCHSTSAGHEGCKQGFTRFSFC